MSVEVIGFVVRVYADPERNTDRQQENLEKIKGFEKVLDFQWSFDTYWELQFDINVNRAATVSACERAIKRARKAKPDEVSKIESDYLRCQNDRQERDFLRRGGMKIYFAKG